MNTAKLAAKPSPALGFEDRVLLRVTSDDGVTNTQHHLTPEEASELAVGLAQAALEVRLTELADVFLEGIRSPELLGGRGPDEDEGPEFLGSRSDDAGRRGP